MKEVFVNVDYSTFTQPDEKNAEINTKLISPKTILFCVDDINYRGGAYFVLCHNIKLLHRNGYKIHVMSIKAPGNDILDEMPYVHFLNLIPYERVNEDSTLYIINKYNIVCVPFENSEFRFIVSYSKAYKIQWIHQDYKAWIETTNHGRELSVYDKDLYRYYDKVVFAAKNAEQTFLQLYPEHDKKTTVCYNLIDIQSIKSNLKEDIDEPELQNNVKPFTIVTVTWIDIQKALDRNLQVIRRLVDSGYKFLWKFIGDGEDFEKIKKQCEDLELNEYVVWLGYKSNPVKYIKNADLFALFSLCEAGTPLAIYEALIVGIPVISTCYRTNEDNTPINTGWNVDNNEEAIYNGIKYLLDNREIISSAKKALRGYKYNMQGYEKKILDVFPDNCEKKTEVNREDIIPKTIHYCWFGNNPKNEKVLRCMQSWQQHMSDYKIVEWNESNCDITINDFVEKAYKAKKWAFVADYFRFKVLYEHGGIYLDTDVLINKPFDDFLHYNAFFSMESNDYVCGGVIGAAPGCRAIRLMQDEYHNMTFIPTRDDMVSVNVLRVVTKVLSETYKFQNTGSTQFLRGNIAVFSPNIMIINVDDGKNYSEHLYDSHISWLDEADQLGDGKSWKYEVLKNYFYNLQGRASDKSMNQQIQVLQGVQHADDNDALPPDVALIHDMHILLERYGAKRIIWHVLKTRIYQHTPQIVRCIYKKIRKR